MPTEETPSYHSVAQIEVYCCKDSYKVFDYKTRLYYTYHRFSDQAHKPVLIEDERGFSIQFKYNEGRLVKIIDSRGKTLDVTTDRYGRITQIVFRTIGAYRNLVSYVYNEKGEMVTIADSLNQKTTIAYDDHHRMIKKTDRNGQSFYWQYDNSGKCIYTCGDEGLLEGSFQYNKDHTIVTDPAGLKEILYYNAAYKPIQIIDALGNSKYFKYSDKGQLIEEVDEEGFTTKYGYDGNGSLVKTTLPDGSSYTNIYDAEIRLLLSVDPMGNTNQRVYKEARLISLRNASGEISDFIYNEENLVSKIINAEGEETFLQYDGDYNLIQLTLPDSRITQWHYNAFGECIEVINPLGKKQQFDYDRLGRLTEVRLPNKEIIDLKYDAYDNVLQANSLHTKIKYSYTPLGNIKSREEKGVRVTFDYDKQERLLALSNEKGDKYNFFRNERGDITKEVSFDGITKFYNRDKAGKVVKVKRPGGKTTEYEYDKGGRIIRAQYHDCSWETFTYNKLGQLLEARNQQTEVIFVRDKLGRVLEEKQGEHVLTYQYDEKGNLLSLKSSLGADVTYTRDKNGCVSDIAAKHNDTAEAWTATIRRNIVGLEIERTLPGGIKNTWVYDDNNNPIGQKITQNNQRTSLHKNYSWNSNQQLQSITNALTNGITRFEYDMLDKLAWAQYEDKSYDYKLPDEIGNLYRSKNRDDKKYGKGGKLIQDSNWHYHYDEEGNLVHKARLVSLDSSQVGKITERPRFSFLIDNEEPPASDTRSNSSTNKLQGDWYYRWFANGMLQQVTDPEGKTISFEYDALGRRTAKILKEKINRYIWDGNVLLHEWSYNISEKPKPIINTEGKLTTSTPEPVNENLITWIYEAKAFVPSAKLIGNEKFSIVSDYIGRPIQAYSERGKLVWETDYDIYGKLRNLNGQETFIPFRQLGQYADEELEGLYYNRFRYYDSNTGGYISQDPIRLEGNNPNFYAYTRDSNRIVDIFGLIECSLGEHGEYVYRFDERSPEQIKLDGGFKSWGNDMDLYKHADGTNIANKTSGYISTSKSSAFPRDLATGYEEGYIYKIQRPSGAIDVNEALGKPSPFKNENEIAVPKHIPYEKIVSWSDPYK
jgi:RHS repeat-associated protein